MTRREIRKIIEDITSAYKDVIGSIAEWADTGSLKSYKEKSKKMEDLLVDAMVKCAD